MKRPIHHQTVGARRAVPFDVAGAVARIIGFFKKGHGSPCPYGGGGNSVGCCVTGGEANSFLRDGGHQKRYVNPRRGTAGFTLVELVVVIVIVGILSALGGQFIVAPITGYIDLSRRARLVDQAEMAMRRMQRDIRAALPNSIKFDPSNPEYLELINTVAGGRYRRYVDPDADCNDQTSKGCDFLEFNKDVKSFEVLGGLGDDPEDNNFEGRYIVVYNVSPVFPPERAKIDKCKIVDEDTDDEKFVCKFDLSKFTQPSPYQRFFIVDNKVMYKCEGDELRRYVIDVNDSGDGPYSLVTRGIEKCEFTYSPGTTQRAGLVTLKLILSEAGEEVTLLHQVHVVNAP